MRLIALVPLVLAPLACSPLVRPPNFVGARDQVTDATLLGPFDGQVVDATTSEPIADATVVAVWSYDRGDGFIGPYGAETYSATTDAAGRYRIPSTRLGVRGSTVRLVEAYLVVYKRGYAGYRSDALLAGGPRSDFTVRHNKIELRKWQDSDSHAAHLLFLAPPRSLQKDVRWEAELANLDLYRALGGAGTQGPAGEQPAEAKPAVTELLDASALLTPDEVRQRTHYSDAFEIKDLTDLKRTDFYHGVHLQASGRDERYDLALRVWKAPPGGMEPVIATIRETFAGAEPTGDITAETWTLTEGGVHAVAFIDREQKVGVLLTCGDLQCADLDTAIILAKFASRNLDRLRTAAPPAADTSARPAAESAPVPDGALPREPAGKPAGSTHAPGSAGLATPTGTKGQPPADAATGLKDQPPPTTGPKGQPPGGAGPKGQPTGPKGQPPSTGPKGQAPSDATGPKGQASGAAGPEGQPTSPKGQPPSGAATGLRGQAPSDATGPKGQAPGAAGPEGQPTSPKGQPPSTGPKGQAPGAAGPAGLPPAATTGPAGLPPAGAPEQKGRRP